MNIVSLWNPQSDNPANRAFIKAFSEKYNRVPTVYAAQTYDPARLIGPAPNSVDGNVKDTEAFRNALRNVKFDSIRGNFAFGKNQHAVIDWYLLRVEADANGKLVQVPVQTIAKSQVDSFAAECAL